MEKRIALFGKSLLLFACTNMLLVSLKLLLHLTVGKDVFFASLFITAIYLVFGAEKSKRFSLSTAINIIILLLIIIGAIKTAEAIYDFSYDGQVYHQEALMYLYDDWNPVYEQTELGPERDMWVTHYAKAIWFMGISVYEVTDKIETSKTFNIILFISTFCLLIEFLRNYSIGWIRTILFSIALISSPVVLNQILTNYNDFHIHLLLLNTIMAYITFFRRYDNGSLFVLFFTTIILINIKFTALGYALIFTGFPILFVLYKKYILKEAVYFKKLAITLFASFFLAIGVVGASSYIKNTITNGHPFYPLAGEGKVDIITVNTPKVLLNKNRFEKIFISTFSETSNTIEHDITYKIPFTFSKEELQFARNTDTRVAGFGPLFGGIMILLLIICIVHFRKIIKAPGFMPLIFLLAVITLSIFINPETFWARYIPQYWFIPLIILLFMYINKIKSVLIYIMLGLYLINSGIVAVASAEAIYSTKTAQDQQLENLKELSKDNTLYVNIQYYSGNRTKFKERGIEYVEVQATTCENPIRLAATVTEICIQEK